MDNTKEIIDSIGDPRIVYIYGENGGAGHARNIGIEYATGEYIAFHDSDDYCRTDRIETQIKFLHDTNSDMVFAQLARHMLEDPSKVYIFPEDGRIGKSKEETYKNFLTKSAVWTQIVLCKSECAKKIRFNEMLPAMEDWEWSLRIAKEYKVSWQREIIVDSYISENSISRSSYNKMITLQMMAEIYKEDICKYQIQSVWEFLIAFYKYNDNPKTHFDYGIKSLKYAIKMKSIKELVFGCLYIVYFTPMRKIIRGIKYGITAKKK